MNGSLHNTMKQLSVGLMIFIMTVMLVNKLVYIHVHVLPNGTVVTHAHPFNKTTNSEQGQSHHHSNLEFFILHALEIMILSSAVVLTLMNLSRTIEKRWFIQEYHTPGLIPISPGRAPPHCM